METVADFIFLGSKITMDSDCSHEIKRCSFLGRKAMTNLDSILKSRDITLPTKVHVVKTMVFPVVMYECESLGALLVGLAGFCLSAAPPFLPVADSQENRNARTRLPPSEETPGLGAGS